MKIRITFKTPDAVENAIMQEIGHDDDQYEKCIDAARKFFKYMEYCVVELDTEQGTCSVVPQ